MSQQALREAFSEAELLAAKKKHQQVQEHIQVSIQSVRISEGQNSWNIYIFTHTLLQHPGVCQMDSNESNNTLIVTEINYYDLDDCATANGGGVA